MLKEAIEKIEELAKPIILDVDNRTYAVNKNGEAQEIIPEAVYQSCLSLNSLDALVQMVKTEGTWRRSSGQALPVREGSYDGDVLRPTPARPAG